MRSRGNGDTAVLRSRGARGNLLGERRQCERRLARCREDLVERLLHVLGGKREQYSLVVAGQIRHSEQRAARNGDLELRKKQFRKRHRLADRCLENVV